jgi:hypothetical protein
VGIDSAVHPRGQAGRSTLDNGHARSPERLALHRGERLRVAASSQMPPAGLDGPVLFLRLAQRWPARGDENDAGHEPGRD